MGDLRQRLLDKIRAAVPSDEECEQYGDICPHPIHLGGSVDGVVTDVFAEVEGLVDLILEEVWSTDAGTTGPAT